MGFSLLVIGVSIFSTPVIGTSTFFVNGISSGTPVTGLVTGSLGTPGLSPGDPAIGDPSTGISSSPPPY